MSSDSYSSSRISCALCQSFISVLAIVLHCLRNLYRINFKFHYKLQSRPIFFESKQQTNSVLTCHILTRRNHTKTQINTRVNTLLKSTYVTPYILYHGRLSTVSGVSYVERTNSLNRCPVEKENRMVGKQVGREVPPEMEEHK